MATGAFIQDTSRPGRSDDVDGDVQFTNSPHYPRTGWRQPGVLYDVAAVVCCLPADPGNVAFNLLQLVANGGFAALQDPNNIEQALLIHVVLQVLSRQPLVVVPALVLLGV